MEKVEEEFEDMKRLGKSQTRKSFNMKKVGRLGEFLSPRQTKDPGRQFWGPPKAL